MFFVLFWQGRSKCGPLLIWGGCCKRWGAALGLLPGDGEGDCVWPASADAKEFIWGGEPGSSRERVLGAPRGCEL